MGKSSDTDPMLPDNRAEHEAWTDHDKQDRSERSYNDAKARSDAGKMFKEVMDKSSKRK